MPVGDISYPNRSNHKAEHPPILPSWEGSDNFLQYLCLCHFSTVPTSMEDLERSSEQAHWYEAPTHTPYPTPPLKDLFCQLLMFEKNSFLVFCFVLFLSALFFQINSN